MLTKKNVNQKNEIKNNKNSKIFPSSEKNFQTGASSTPTYSSQSSLSPQTSSGKTKVTIKYNAGFPNQLFIRGKGANLSWEKGQPLKNTKPDEWVWETDTRFSSCEFKILINDTIYETGENHLLNEGANILYTPSF